MKRFLSLTVASLLILALAGCGAGTAAPAQSERTQSSESTAASAEASSERTPSEAAAQPGQTGLFAEQILSGAEGDIHYSYYLPKHYDGSRKFPLMMVMPGYDMMWFGAESSGSNLNWSGFTAWTKLDSDTEIDQVLRLELPDNAFFNEQGIFNYHGGANVVFDDPENLNWVISHSKG